MRLTRCIAIAALTIAASGCATKPYDYTNFREHPPRSIAVLPPINETTTVEGTYSYYSTVTQPLAERGYYVFPVVIVDQFLKENGMPTPGEMHQVPVKKYGEILGADAVLYVTLKEYGTQYRILKSVPTVRADAKLVDTRTGTLLWDGTVTLQQQSQGSGNLLADLIVAAVSQAVNTTTDQAHSLCGPANTMLFAREGNGLLYGPYHPKDTHNP